MTWPWAFAGSALALSVAWIVWAYHRYAYLDAKDERQALLAADKSETADLLAELEKVRGELVAAENRIADLERRR